LLVSVDGAPRRRHDESIPSFLHFHNMADSRHNMLGLHFKSWVWTMKWWMSSTIQAARLSWVWWCAGKPWCF
jgi:hypothetical protein